MNTESIAISATQKQRISNNELEYFFRVPSQLTNGKFGIYEALFKHKDNGADLHYHKEMTEVFTVLEGEFRFALQDEEKLLKKGDSIMIPPMIIHGFKSTRDNSKVVNYHG
jgi:mannose-6-phosphate isomerase-like protein (cupin superfamily)